MDGQITLDPSLGRQPARVHGLEPGERDLVVGQILLDGSAALIAQPIVVAMDPEGRGQDRVPLDEALEALARQLRDLRVPRVTRAVAHVASPVAHRCWRVAHAGTPAHATGTAARTPSARRVASMARSMSSASIP